MDVKVFWGQYFLIMLSKCPKEMRYFYKMDLRGLEPNLYPKIWDQNDDLSTCKPWNDFDIGDFEGLHRRF